MNVLQANTIRKEFGTLVAVNDVSLAVDEGQVLGLIGPNGAGKTTLLRILATLLRPTSGTASILEHDLTKDYLAIRKHIGYMPDFFNLYNDLTLTECLTFFATAYDIPKDRISQRVEQALADVELSDKRSVFLRHLSRGMVQRMGVAVMLVHEPRLLLLDEPASGLDPKARIQLREILKALAQKGKAIIISSHILTELSGFCSHIVIMHQGRVVVSGPVEEIQQRIAGSRRVVISVMEDADKASALVEAFPDTRLTATNAMNLTAEISGGVDQLAALNAHLVNNGVRVYAFWEEKMGLEDIFMSISSSPQRQPAEG